jgi:hypothetical protein
MHVVSFGSYGVKTLSSLVAKSPQIAEPSNHPDQMSGTKVMKIICDATLFAANTTNQ